MNYEPFTPNKNNPLLLWLEFFATALIIIFRHNFSLLLRKNCLGEAEHNLDMSQVWGKVNGVGRNIPLE
jgi:hypothetical protein